RHLPLLLDEISIDSRSLFSYTEYLFDMRNQYRLVISVCQACGFREGVRNWLRHDPGRFITGKRKEWGNENGGRILSLALRCKWRTRPAHDKFGGYFDMRALRYDFTFHTAR